MQANMSSAGMTIKLRENRVFELKKQLMKTVTRLLELEVSNKDDTEMYKGLFLKAKECSCLIKLHEKSIKDFKLEEKHHG